MGINHFQSLSQEGIEVCVVQRSWPNDHRAAAAPILSGRCLEESGSDKAGSSGEDGGTDGTSASGDRVGRAGARGRRETGRGLLGLVGEAAGGSGDLGVVAAVATSGGGRDTLTDGDGRVDDGGHAGRDGLDRGDRVAASGLRRLDGAVARHALDNGSGGLLMVLVKGPLVFRGQEVINLRRERERCRRDQSACRR